MNKGRDSLDYNHYIEQTRQKNGYKSYSITSDYTITNVDKIKTLWASAQATTTITVTLPLASSNLDRTIDIMKIDSNVTPVYLSGVSGTTTCTINGNATATIGTTQYLHKTVKTDGSNWFVMVTS
jgi:hypothetical protein